LHVSSEVRGLGVGQALIDAVRSEWFDPNADTFLDVAADNEAGQRFYSRPPNDYEFTGHTFFYGPIAMLQMIRRANG
jgi:ribosomal protein S18 acetylase RimI-like enzyme